MPCEPFVSKDGTIVGIACSRGKRKPKCAVCNRPGVALCDFPLDDGRTCDKPMCDLHRHHIGADIDVCDKHFNQPDIKKTLEGGQT